ncbi:MAG: hypothetical protein HND58_14440 [Planctomycetota bacterium]|nr:MAG: hypothetical protein HND58_14440 [Planctomycetota bacterium]
MTLRCPANPRRLSRRWVWGLVAVLGVTVLPVRGATQAGESGEVAPAGAAESVPDLLAVLTSPDTTAEARAEAADGVLRLGPEDPVFVQATSFLATPEGDLAGGALAGAAGDPDGDLTHAHAAAAALRARSRRWHRTPRRR